MISSVLLKKNTALFVGGYWPNQLYKWWGGDRPLSYIIIRNKSQNLPMWTSNSNLPENTRNYLDTLGGEGYSWGTVALWGGVLRKCIIDEALYSTILITYELARKTHLRENRQNMQLHWEQVQTASKPMTNTSHLLGTCTLKRQWNIT